MASVVSMHTHMSQMLDPSVFRSYSLSSAAMCVQKLSPHIQTPHPSPTHPQHACRAPVNTDTCAHRWVDAPRVRHSHPHRDGWVGTTSLLTQPPTLMATVKPPAVNPGSESSPTLCCSTHATCPSPEAPTVRVGNLSSSPLCILTQLHPGKSPKHLGN